LGFLPRVGFTTESGELPRVKERTLRCGIKKVNVNVGRFKQGSQVSQRLVAALGIVQAEK
jgi:hypothetical protein